MILQHLSTHGYDFITVLTWVYCYFKLKTRTSSFSEITKDNGSIFGSIIRLLNHNYIVDCIWQAHLNGNKHNIVDRNPKNYPVLEELWFLQQKIDNWYIAYYDEILSAKLSERVEFILMSGTCGIMSREEILAHVVNHCSYHRGFIAEIMYKIPVQPPVTDFPVFLQGRLWELFKNDVIF